MTCIATRYSQEISALRIVYLFSQIQNGQTPWGCASDEILDLFKSAGVYVLILLDCGYETHGAMRIMLALILSDTDYMVYRMIVTA